MSDKHKHQKRYTSFYLILLILSTLGSAISLLTISTVGRTVEYYSVAPTYASLMLVDTLTIPLGIIGLLLLYQKRKAGLVFTIVSYAIGVLVSAGMLLCVDQFASYMLSTADPISSRSIANSAQLMAAVNLFCIVILLTSIIISVTYGTLWYFAWKHQMRADRLSDKSGHSKFRHHAHPTHAATHK